MYLIVGANGFLGSYFIKEILAKTEDSIIATARQMSQVLPWGNRVRWQSLDVMDRELVQKLASQLRDEREGLKIVYLAAYHHPDMVEKNPEVAWDINITSLSYFMNAMGRVKSFFYPSTDSVYGESGESVRLTEEASLHPTNCYGRQKALAEALVTGYGHNVVRYPFLIAPSLLKHKKHFYDVIVETITSAKSMEMFEDSYRSSLDFGTAAGLTVDLIEKGEDVPPILNVSGDDALSKYDIGLMIADKCGVDRKYIKPVCVKDTRGIFTAPRAVATILDNTLLKNILGLEEIKISI